MKSFIVACLTASALALPAAVPQLSGSSSTKNDVVNGVCRPVTYIFARGTSELGNMGSIVGPPLETALESAFGAAKVATQGVTYAADVAGAITGALDPAGAAGAKTMAALTKQVLAACPSTKVILAGYSQGAEQVHGALMNLASGQVTVAITFGDPLSKTAFQNIDASHTKVYCNTGDAVCDQLFIISAAHLSYGTLDATPAAAFAKSIIGTV